MCSLDRCAACAAKGLLRDREVRKRLAAAQHAKGVGQGGPQLALVDYSCFGLAPVYCCW